MFFPPVSNIRRLRDLHVGLAPLPTAERAEFMRMQRVLTTANNEPSRAPSDAGSTND